MVRYRTSGDGIDGVQHTDIIGRFVWSPLAGRGTQFPDGKGIGPSKGTGGKVSHRQEYPCLGFEPTIRLKSTKVQDWCNQPAQFPSYRPGSAPSRPRRDEQVLAFQVKEERLHVPVDLVQVGVKPVGKRLACCTKILAAQDHFQHSCPGRCDGADIARQVQQPSSPILGYH